MKNILTFVTAIFISISFIGHAQTFEDLLILRADANWDKLIKKAEQYTLNNKFKKEPEPYYYLAFGLYKISFEADRDDKYKNAYKNAFNSIGKMFIYDKSGEVQEKYAEFIDELKESLLEIIQNDLDNEEYRRAFGWVMRMYKFGRDYAPAYYLEAPLRHRNDDPSTARIKWEEGEKHLKTAEPIENWREIDKKFLMVGLYQSAKVLKENLQAAKAKELMKMGDKSLSELSGWDEYYKEIMR